jgi:hypothetical protein
MNINPNGYSGPTLNQFQDAGPLQEGCDLATCTDRVGGEHSERCEVSRYRCYLCRRDTSDGLYRLVDYGLHMERVCDICYDRGDEGVEIPLDYTEDVP